MDTGGFLRRVEPRGRVASFERPAAAFAMTAPVCRVSEILSAPGAMRPGGIGGACRVEGVRLGVRSADFIHRRIFYKEKIFSDACYTCTSMLYG